MGDLLSLRNVFRIVEPVLIRWNVCCFLTRVRLNEFAWIVLGGEVLGPLVLCGIWRCEDSSGYNESCDTCYGSTQDTDDGLRE